jgi:hypothetical protein
MVSFLLLPIPSRVSTTVPCFFKVGKIAPFFLRFFVIDLHDIHVWK